MSREGVAGRVRRRAESKEETRLALLEAALAELGEHGLDTPSLDAICARAGYTRGAFYVHFRDRGDLLVAVVEHAMGVFLDAVIAHGDEAHDLERTIVRFADAVAASVGSKGDGGRAAGAAVASRSTAPSRSRVAVRGGGPALPLPASIPFARILDAVTRNERLRERFTALLAVAVGRVEEVTARAQDAGSVRADVDSGQVGALLTLVALGTLVALDAGMPLDPPALRATVLRLLGAADAPAPRRRRPSVRPGR